MLYEEIIRTHLAKYGVVVELGKTLVGIDQDANNVTATVITKQQNETEMQETIVAQYLVGSDGAKGTSWNIFGADLIYT
jgi:2-polyprenyl-6-methoxyphenol hydroxylase-like FAD-dependent oxidoreductase